MPLKRLKTKTHIKVQFSEPSLVIRMENIFSNWNDEPNRPQSVVS
jgi:hypothetical protein